MRAISSAQVGVRFSGVQSEYVRLSIKDGGGTFRDLGTYPGYNAVKSITWGEQVEDPHMTFDVTLVREAYKLSLSPFMTTSALNKAFDPAASFSALIALNREVKIEVAIVAMDHQPSSGDWMEVFRGRVDELDASAGQDVRMGGRSLGGRLAQQYIKTELVYSYAEVSGVAKALRVWEPQIPVVINKTYLLPATRGVSDSGYGRFFKCSQSGTTGTSEPTWTTGTNIADGTAKWDYVAAPTTSGNPVEEVIQNILDDHKSTGDSTVTLYVPTSPGWAIREFLQAREFVLDAVLALARQIGWDLRYKWRAATSQFEFTLFSPPRTVPSGIDLSFGASDYANPSKLGVQISNIRNSWRIIYSDTGSLWPDGSAKRKIIEVSDGTSISKYGELWAEIQEDENSGINTSTEATTLINSALSDTKEPTADMSLELTRGFPWVEIHDYYSFAANNLHFDTDQSMAVTGWKQTYDGGNKLKTSLELRGYPTLGAKTWLIESEHIKIPHNERPPICVPFNGTVTPSALVIYGPGGQTMGVGGASMAIDQTKDKNRLPEDELEIHIYTTPGGTLDDDTLKEIIRGSGKAHFTDQVPGKQYYGKTVQRSYSKNKLIRGQPSAEFTYIAARASAGHIDSQALTIGPPNGKFQTVNDDITQRPPDHWTVIDGDWAEGSDLYAGDGSDQGRVIFFGQTSYQGILLSGSWPITRGARRAKLIVTVSPIGTLSVGRDLQFHLYFFKDQGLEEVAGEVDVVVPYNVAAAGVWTEYIADVDVPTDANFCQMRAYKASSSSAYGFALAGVYFQPTVPQSNEDWITVNGGVGFNTGWSDYPGTYMRAAQYMKDANGIVHLRGEVRRTSGSNLKIFTLPSGYRPSAWVFFAVQATSAYGDIQIDPSNHATQPGAVNLGVGTPTYISLDGIHFDIR